MFLKDDSHETEFQNQSYIKEKRMSLFISSTNVFLDSFLFHFPSFVSVAELQEQFTDKGVT